MAIRTFEFIEVQYDKLSNQINNWLKTVYSKVDILFNSSSPYGQINNVQKELFQHNLLYLKNTVKVLDIENTENVKVIQQTSRIAGHNPGRAISATGTLKFKLKPGIDISKEIKDSVLIIPNNLLLKNKNNSLNYIAKLNSDRNIYSINLPGSEFFLPIIQGKFETQTYTGDGTYNQSFSVNIPNSAQIENFNYTITYNSIVLTVKDHLYDMLPNEYSCFVRSGFNGGLDVYFGNENHGFLPAAGSLIEVDYLLSDGSLGEIMNPISNEWKIEGDVKDGQDNILNMDKLFNITTENDVNFASDGENIKFTKNIIPYVSRNFVLSTPNQFIFHLKRLNLFSKVNAFNMLDDNNFGISEQLVDLSAEKIKQSVNNNDSYDKIITAVNDFKSVYGKYKTTMNDNQIYLYLIPDITKYFNDNVNYFNIPFDVFYLDEEEQDKTLSYLKLLGTVSITTNIKIIQPKISRYVMHVYIRRYSDANEENIKQEIISLSSDYLLNNERFDRIPKSDFVTLFKDIDGVDSASIYFVSKKNEDYHAKNIQLGYEKSNVISSNSRKNIKTKNILSEPSIIKDGQIQSIYDDNKLLGIDIVHGDIVIEKDEYAIIRGGFRDRNGIWYSENPNENTLNSINIVFDGITEQ